MTNTARSITIDGRRHQLRHIGPRVAAIIAEADEQQGGLNLPTPAGALWAAHCEALARSAWGPRGYVRGSRLDSSSPDGQVRVYELTLCRDGRHGTEFVNRWATRDREELAAAAALLH